MLKATLGQTSKKDFLLHAVREADFNISDIVSRKDNKGDDKIEFEHTYANGSFSMPIESESAGTLSFVGKMDQMYEVIHLSSPSVQLLKEYRNKAFAMLRILFCID